MEHLCPSWLPLLLAFPISVAIFKAALPASGCIVACHSETAWTPSSPALGPVTFGFTQGSSDTIAQVEAWDREFGWSAPRRPGADTNDTEAWPPLLGIAEGWSLDGLDGPLVYVLSMPESTSRRQRFAQRFRGLSLRHGFDWAPVVDGRKMPAELRWMRGSADAKSSDSEAWAHYVTHLAVMRESLKRCAKCDLVVLEDDVVFKPSFLRAWSSFVGALPKDWAVLHLGAWNQTEPPHNVAQHFMRAASVPNSWGYVVRSGSLARVADLVAGLPARGAGGVEAVLEMFAGELSTYMPVVPLVLAASAFGQQRPSNTSKAGKPIKTSEPPLRSAERAVFGLLQDWPQGYARAYCLGPGQPRPEHNSARGCHSNKSSAACCPYDRLPPKPKLPVRRKDCKFVRDVFNVHISKTGGTSLNKDIHLVLPSCSNFISIETCIGAMQKRIIRGHGHLISMVRTPRTHVYSMYLHCKHFWFAYKRIPQAKRHLLQNFTTWLTHFNGGSEQDDLTCYHPLNFQTRFLSCEDGGHYAPHHLPGSKDNPQKVPDALNKALRNFKNLTLGITERYQESLCLIAAKVAPDQDLPAFCNCADSIAWSTFRSKNVTHASPKHSLKDLSASELSLIDQFVKDDVQLYEAATKKFELEVRQLEKERRVKILC